MTTRHRPLPTEAHGRLVEALEELHRAAGRPGMRRVSTLIAAGDHPASPSHEAVRTTLKGRVVPRWETVQSIVGALAAMCVDPPRDPASEVARFFPLWREVQEGENRGMKSGRELALSEGWGGEDGRWTGEAVAGLILNPATAIEIHPSLAVPHEPLISEDQWVSAGVRLIEEAGAEFALRALLRILKGDYIGAEGGAPFGYRPPEWYEVDQAYEVFRYGCQEVRRRLRDEPNLLPRSIAAMRADTTLSPDERTEMIRAEADAGLMREVMTLTPESWDEVSEEAHRQVFDYLIKEIRVVGRPSLSPERRFQITWRVPEPATADDT
ncbi:hypothetical protein [Streptomyces sp. NPDC089919]|uniref:hypothetical protein n=1 Tax=Streptomyces sp. NPDC089919 TaxID=3155188 RepID=UPI003447A793